MYLTTQSKYNVSALELKRHLGVRYKAAWLMKHKLLQVMHLREDTRRLDGRVEVDDAYLGGRLPGGKRGRGSENKVSFIAAVQTDSAGHPQLACLQKLKTGVFAKTKIHQGRHRWLGSKVAVRLGSGRQ